MQLTPTFAANLPTRARVENDVVSPTKLFTIASTRFDAALRVLGGEKSPFAPSSLSASIAAREATSGFNTLKSIMVPSTPWGHRQRATTSALQARRALDTLETYSLLMAPRGDGPFQRPNLAPGTLVLLDNARSALRSAIQAIATA